MDDLVTAQHARDATVTVRLIKSFEYRTFKNVVLHGVDLEQATPMELRRLVQEKISATPALRPYQTNSFDTFKIFHTAHASKTSDLIVNRDHDDYILRDDASLWENGVRNETEVSFFNRDQYEAYKQHPEKKW